MKEINVTITNTKTVKLNVGENDTLTTLLEKLWKVAEVGDDVGNCIQINSIKNEDGTVLSGKEVSAAYDF